LAIREKSSGLDLAAPDYNQGVTAVKSATAAIGRHIVGILNREPALCKLR
jgi:hypothetical protein